MVVHADRATSEGFTLFETLVAFLILSIAMASAIQVASQSALLASSTQSNEMLRLKGRALLAELEGSIAGSIETNGTLGDGTTWSWRVAPYRSGRDSHLFQFALTVTKLDNPQATAVFTGISPSHAKSTE